MAPIYQRYTPTCSGCRAFPQLRLISHIPPEGGDRGTGRRASLPVCLLGKGLAYSKFVSLFTSVALALPSSGKAQEENAKISQTLTTQNSSLLPVPVASPTGEAAEISLGWG